MEVPQSFGVVLALVALVSWGFCDFLLQRSARRFGSWESIFAMALIGTVMLFPLAVPLLISSDLSVEDLTWLPFISASFFCAMFMGVEALRRGKLSVVESAGVIEIPVAGILAYIILAENIALTHWLIVGVLLFGVMLVVLHSHVLRGRTWLEPGAFLGIFAGIMFGVTGFLVGYVARETNPIVTVWGFNVVMAFVCFLYLSLIGRTAHFAKDFRKNAALMVGVGVLDSVAWLAYALSATAVPIIIAGVLSEGYIVLAVLLGVIVNRERLTMRQGLGILVAMTGAAILSTLYA
jgi:drug/metabolite transporter (DMT)-like permease